MERDHARSECTRRGFISRFQSKHVVHIPSTECAPSTNLTQILAQAQTSHRSTTVRWPAAHGEVTGGTYLRLPVATRRSVRLSLHPAHRNGTILAAFCLNYRDEAIVAAGITGHLGHCKGVKLSISMESKHLNPTGPLIKVQIVVIIQHHVVDVLPCVDAFLLMPPYNHNRRLLASPTHLLFLKQIPLEPENEAIKLA